MRETFSKISSVYRVIFRLFRRRRTLSEANHPADALNVVASGCDRRSARPVTSEPLWGPAGISISDSMYPSSQSAASLGLHAAAAAAAAASLGALPVSIAQQTSSIYSGATGGGLLTTAADARVVSRTSSPHRRVDVCVRVCVCVCRKLLWTDWTLRYFTFSFFCTSRCT